MSSKEKKEGKTFFLNENRVWQILHNLVSHVIILSKYELFHADIKPSNILIDYSIDKDEIYFRFIDFGATINSFDQIIEATDRYFYNPNVNRTNKTIYNK